MTVHWPGLNDVCHGTEDKPILSSSCCGVCCDGSQLGVISNYVVNVDEEQERAKERSLGYPDDRSPKDRKIVGGDDCSS